MKLFKKFVVFCRNYMKEFLYIAVGAAIGLIFVYRKGNLEGVEMQTLVSLILGVISLVAWYIPLFGVPISIAGLVFGIIGCSSSSIGYVIAGISMSSFGLILSIFNAYFGAKNAIDD